MDARLQIDGWAEAVHRERNERDESWCEPFDEIAGVVVRHCTLIDLLRLQRAGNPFATRTPPVEVDKVTTFFARQFVLYLSRGYLDACALLRWFAKRRVNRIDPAQLIAECASYAKRTFCDDIGTTEGKKIEVTYWSVIADYYHIMAGEYGMQLRDFEQMPYRRLMQMVRKTLKAKDPKQVFISESDRIVGDYLEKKNDGI